MKRTAIVILCLLFAVSVGAQVPKNSIPPEPKEEESTYEVSITVVYNALPLAEATAKASYATMQHDKACTSKVTVRKNGGIGSYAITDFYITTDTN